MKNDYVFKGGDKRHVVKLASIPVNKIGADALKKELNAWLETRTVWNHEDWLRLLSDLRCKGYNDLIDTQKGQEAIGLYLETNRKKMASC